MATEPQPGVPQLPDPLIEARSNRSIWVFWLIPLVAIVVGGFLGLRALLDHGPRFRIEFISADGLEAGKTRVKYKNVDIGLVRTIDLLPDHSQVIVTAELNRGLDWILAADSKFWVVRPRIAATGVSGLGTLLSGAYIGVDIGKMAARRRDFIGLEIPPAITTDSPGRAFVLRADDLGSLEVGSPVYFRRVSVGQVAGYELDTDGTSVTIQIFVDAPYDRFVVPETRFWQASGLDVTLDPSSGLKVDLQLASIVVGAVAFETPPGTNIEKTDEAPPYTRFKLASNRTDAYRRPDVSSSQYVMKFNGSVRGLNIGAPVDFRGIVLGEVTDIRVDFVAPDKDLDMVVNVRVYPERLRSLYVRPVADASPDRERRVVDGMVRRGFRAQLRSGNLLTGQLYVALDFFPQASPAQVDWATTPPELPTVPGTLDTLEQSLLAVAQKLQKIPWDALGTDAQHTVHDLDQAVVHADTAMSELATTLQRANTVMQQVSTDIAPETQATLKDARRALDNANRTFASLNDTVGTDSALQAHARQTLSDISSAARALRVLADYLEQHPEALLHGKPKEQQ